MSPTNLSVARSAVSGQPAVPKCRLCEIKLSLVLNSRDDLDRRLCEHCQNRREAMLPEFTLAEKSLIRSVHGYMPLKQLLQLLNERLVADRGKSAAVHSMEQLHAELGGLSSNSSASPDWAGLRQLLAQARKDGLLRQINAQTLNDFAIVYSLSPGQLMRLQDVLINTGGGDAAIENPSKGSAHS